MIPDEPGVVIVEGSPNPATVVITEDDSKFSFYPIVLLLYMYIVTCF